MGDFLSNLSNLPQYAADWWNGKRSINPVALAWNSLPGNVKDTYTSGARALIDMSTPASVRDYTTSAQDAARSAMEGDGWGAATNGLGMVNAALGAIPIAGMGVRAAQKGAQLGGKALGMGVREAAQDTPGFIRAYHGSPHSFDKFDLSKIGTGEGVQAYGHGLYFAEEPKIAETYRAKVAAMHGLPGATIGGNPINWDDPLQAAAFEVARHNGDRAAAADFYERTFKSSDVPSIIRSNANLPEVKMPGHMYEVAIHADPAKMLNIEKPIGQQTPYVRSAIEQTKGMLPPNALDDLGGDLSLLYGNQIKPNQFLSTMEAIGGRPDSGEQMLRQAGVPGAHYLDAGSRAAGEGSRNYVVFDDSIIKILRKYGLLPAVGGTALYGATAGDTQQGAY